MVYSTEQSAVSIRAKHCT